jgi:hypothetical protein
MLAKRWHVLTAFAGGCLSTVLLVVVWRGEEGALDRADGRDRRTEEREDVVATPPAASVAAVEAATVAVPTPAARAAGEPTAESGRSLAEVLARLEAEYRERLVAVPSRPAPANDEPQPVAPAVPAIAPAPTAVAVPSTVAVAAPAPEVAAPPAVAAPAARAAPPSEPSPVPAAVAMPTRDERTDDADRAARDLYLANLYQMEAYQRQQLAILGYLELLSASSSGKAAPPPGVPVRPNTRRSPSFSFPLTNPNNPWGFNHPPTVLAK